MAESNIEIVQNTINSLHESVLSVILSTINSNGDVETSYSPYFFDGKDYYILIADLAPHSQNIKANAHISAFIIEDESKTKNIYARKRLSFQATANMIEKDSELFNAIIEQFALRVSKMVYMLSEMKDFNLFKISPMQGRLVIGFGKTYQIDHQTNSIIQVDESYIDNQKAQQQS